MKECLYVSCSYKFSALVWFGCTFAVAEIVGSVHSGLRMFAIVRRQGFGVLPV